MGVDYLARKAKKKRNKAENLKPKRERKKKTARRLCRGPCYQEPQLTAEDLQGEGRGRADRSVAAAAAAGAGLAGEQARMKKVMGELLADAKPKKPAAKEIGEGKAVQGKAQGKEQAGKEKKRAQPEAAAAAAAAGAEGGEGGNKKRLKLSTSVNLLDAKSARGEAPRPRQAGVGAGLGGVAAVSEALAKQPDLIQRFMAGEGLLEPMPVQERCWPLLLQGRDVEVVAEPGAGKTLGYLLPGAALLAGWGHGAATQPEGPLLLVVLPTRELAQQVAAVCRDLRKYSGLRAVCLTGGTDKEEQVAALASRRPHIVVATPGRLLDLADGGDLQLGSVRYVVLDEADKMLGMGFQQQIDRLRVLLLPPPLVSAPAPDKTKKKKGEGAGGEKKPVRPQVALFTATMPEALAEVAAAWVHKPERVQISHSAASISRSVTQVVQVCAEHKKPAKLSKHLTSIKEAAKGMRNMPRVLIFANRIKTVRFLYKEVTAAGYRAAMLHGDRSQEEREEAMHDFRSGKVQVLVATDVAARGLHIRGLPYVVNYDFPSNLEQYIHRAGRTGRLAADGHCFSFLTREMAPLAQPLLELLRAHDQAVDPNLVKLAEAYQLAAERLGLLADSKGEAAPARPQTDDVLRTLGLKTKQQRRKKKGAAQQEEEQEGASSEEEGGSSGEEGESESEGEGQAAAGAKKAAGAKQQQQRQQQGAGAANGDADADAGDEPPPFFVPSKSFKGARPGYAFKKGIKGLGYYLDPVQQRQQAQRGSAGKAAAGQKHKQQHQKQLQEKYSKAPIGGPAVAAGVAAGGGSKPKQAAAKAGGPADPAAEAKAGSKAGKGKSKAPTPSKAPAGLLPGQLARLKRERDMEKMEGDDDVSPGGLAGWSDSGEEGGVPAQQGKRKRALPGRLRKKLAAQRQKGGQE